MSTRACIHTNTRIHTQNPSEVQTDKNKWQVESFQCLYYGYPFHEKLYEYSSTLITKQLLNKLLSKFSKNVKNNT